MLSSKVIREAQRQAELHFGNDDARLAGAVAELLDAGWSWEHMRPLLQKVYRAGYDDGYGDGFDAGTD